jgi:tRNA-specific 2-thiouridylase
MSGGVDSSVAAAILQGEGHEVIGITMQVHLATETTEGMERSGGCSGAGAVTDARRVANRLGIPHYVADFRDVFIREVITDFCREYSLGRTPNPCIRCNRFVKFGALLRRAQEFGADVVATGHYARIDRSNGRYLLRKGADHNKDQTYVLYMMDQEQLGHTLFPLGGLTKQEVRRIAERLGLSVATRPESQDICFIPDNDYARFVREYTGVDAGPGPILDREGNVLGEHRGITSYTIGQRKGLGISSGAPLYVVTIDRETNTITVGGKEEVYATELVASALNWVSVERPEKPLSVRAKIRYLHREAEAVVTPSGDDEVRVVFGEPQMAITTGQAVVFYDDDTVVGGGTIARVVHG